ncbi:MAG: ImuA family protein [Tepidisphaeraceae bacterium]
MRRVTSFSGTLLFEDLKDPPEHGARFAGRWLELFQAPAVHELLFDPRRGLPAHVAYVAARHRSPDRPLVWIDSADSLYPPALGTDITRLHLLRPPPPDLAWTATECLRCAHVNAVIVALPNRLTRVEVRRLQLAAEQGDTLGILLRPNLAAAGIHIYSAASRWLVTPAPGERTLQRWRVEHVHGHGRQLGPCFFVEKNRVTGQTHFVHPSPALAHHPKIAAAF